jgi:dihydroorotate dehydrogenase (fumarate)
MIDLKVKYMGLTLRNPIIVGASDLVTDEKTLVKLEEAGAGAIVYKSLFEEQIQLEALELQHDLQSYSHWDAEKASIFPDLEHAGPEEHLYRLKKAKKALSIPLIASLNAVYEPSWVNYAQKIAETGVDALELNFYEYPNNFDKSENQIVEEQVNILKKIKHTVKIPVSVKLSPYYTNLLQVVGRMDNAGADAFVLFNRLFQPDIDIEKEEHQFPYNFSNSNDNRLTLRYAGLLYGHIRGAICASNGVHTGEDMIKMFLAGAHSVQVVSAIYRRGPKQITQMLQELQDWMQQKGYVKLEDFQGKLSKTKTANPFTYKRAQYVDILMHADKFLRNRALEEHFDEVQE